MANAAGALLLRVLLLGALLPGVPLLRSLPPPPLLLLLLPGLLLPWRCWLAATTLSMSARAAPAACVAQWGHAT